MRLALTSVIVVGMLLAPGLAGAETVALLPVEGTLPSQALAEVGAAMSQALADRGDRLVPELDVARALALQGSGRDLDDLGSIAARLRATAVVTVRASRGGAGAYRVEVSAFRPDPPRVELLEQVTSPEELGSEIRAMADQLLSVSPAPAETSPAPETPPVSEEPPAEEPAEAPPPPEEPAAEEPDEEGEATEDGPPAEPEAEAEPRPAYGSRPLEINLFGGPTVLATSPPPQGSIVGGRLGVGVAYCFLDWLGVGLRANLLFYMGNADAFGATIGSGVHWAPLRGVPLYIGLRLGLGVLQSASGARDTYFLLRPEPVIAYRIGRWVQIDVRPASFSLLFGARTIAQYEGLVGVSVMIGNL